MYPTPTDVLAGVRHDLQPHSVAMAVRIRRREPRHAGHSAATTPPTAAKTRNNASCGTLTANSSMPWLARMRCRRAPNETPDDHPEHRAEHRDDECLDDDRAADSSAPHAHRPQQPDLACPFEHTEGKRVHDAQQSDQHGEHQKREQEVQELADLVTDARFERGLVEDLNVGKRFHARWRWPLRRHLRGPPDPSRRTPRCPRRTCRDAGLWADRSRSR